MIRVRVTHEGGEVAEYDVTAIEVLSPVVMESGTYSVVLKPVEDQS